MFLFHVNLYSTKYTNQIYAKPNLFNLWEELGEYARTPEQVGETSSQKGPA